MTAEKSKSRTVGAFDNAAVRQKQPEPCSNEGDTIPKGGLVHSVCSMQLRVKRSAGCMRFRTQIHIKSFRCERHALTISLFGERGIRLTSKACF